MIGTRVKTTSLKGDLIYYIDEPRVRVLERVGGETGKSKISHRVIFAKVKKIEDPTAKKQALSAGHRFLEVRMGLDT